MMDSKNIVDLVLYLDVCQVYLQRRKKNSSNLGTLWAIVTFIRNENSYEFLRWCRGYSVKHLRQDEEPDENSNIQNKEKSKSTKNQKNQKDKKILRALQELFNCGCLPGNFNI